MPPDRQPNAPKLSRFGVIFMGPESAPFHQLIAEVLNALGNGKLIEQL